MYKNILLKSQIVYIMSFCCFDGGYRWLSKKFQKSFKKSDKSKGQIIHLSFSSVILNWWSQCQPEIKNFGWLLHLKNFLPIEIESGKLKNYWTLKKFVSYLIFYINHQFKTMLSILHMYAKSDNARITTKWWADP